MLKITLVKSLIGNTPRNRATVHALGLRKISQSTIQHDTPAIRGMVHHVKHLLKVEVVEDQAITRKRRDPKADKAAAPVKAAKAAAPKAEKAAKPAKATAEKEEAPKPKTRSTKSKKTEE